MKSFIYAALILLWALSIAWLYRNPQDRINSFAMSQVTNYQQKFQAYYEWGVANRGTPDAEFFKGKAGYGDFKICRWVNDASQPGACFNAFKYLTFLTCIVFISYNVRAKEGNKLNATFNKIFLIPVLINVSLIAVLNFFDSLDFKF